MLQAISRKLFGSANDRVIRNLRKDVEAINRLEPEMQALTDSDMQARAETLRVRYRDGESLDALLHEAFALVREASMRVLGLRHFDVQLIGGIILHRGKIIEMRTGEGKTLVATLPAFLNGITGKGVHIVTVNDYLAERDAAEMGPLYRFLGLSVGVVVHGMSDVERKAAYASDITHATNNELGFDYLRDNMKFSKDAMTGRAFNYAIIDEVDSILIDEARTPLIISGPTEDNSTLYQIMSSLIPQLSPTHYEIDEKARTVNLTEEGMEGMEERLEHANLIPAGGSLYDVEHIQLIHHINQALKAFTLFKCDVDYMIKGNKLMIIDEFTGRVMEGRRYSDGLHQALEAKEGLPIQNENQTLASITYQNYFRLYPKLSGMTGTAMTEAAEFGEIYSLDVAEVPTNVPVKRTDEDDVIYRTEAEKYKAIVALIQERHADGQPILVGTVSIEKSEHLSSVLHAHAIPHKVLNARYHEQEAAIIAQAGRFGGVTIATNMAGRGTDIKLGGNPDLLIQEALANQEEDAKEAIRDVILEQHAEEKAKVLSAGGLLVIGTERHESRRIDNQLRGRSGRQGDPGRTIFFLSLEDDLMRIFGSDRLSSMLKTLGLKDDEAIIHPWISKTLAKAQQKVEARNFDIRKNLLKFDNVMNDQRKAIYEQRHELIDAEDLSETILSMREEMLEEVMAMTCPPRRYKEEWDIDGLAKALKRLFALEPPLAEWAAEDGLSAQQLQARIEEHANAFYKQKEEAFTPVILRQIERQVLLVLVDRLWKEHLQALDHLRQGINLRAYGQKDPLSEYKREAFAYFESMLTRWSEEVVRHVYHAVVDYGEEPEQTLFDMNERFYPKRMEEHHDGELSQADSQEGAGREKIGRNDPCFCGSGKKYKFCHGKLV